MKIEFNWLGALIGGSIAYVVMRIVIDYRIHKRRQREIKALHDLQDRAAQEVAKGNKAEAIRLLDEADKEAARLWKELK